MSLFSPNIPVKANFQDKFKYFLIWRISIFAFFFYIFRLALFLKTNETLNVVAIISLSSVIIISAFNFFYLKFTHRVNLAYWIVAICTTILVHFTINNLLVVPAYSSFFWALAIIMLVFIGLGRKMGLCFVFIHSIGIIYFFFFSFNKHIESLQAQGTMALINHLISFFTPFFFIIYLMGQYMIQQTHFSRLLSAANKKLEGRNKIITINNNEITILVKEIHHRVKNSLQIIISLLRLQKSELKSEEAKIHFNEAINRIMVMSLIHEKLYQEKEMAKIKIQSYLTDLAKDITSITNLDFPVTVNISTDTDTVELKTIVPLGLLVNELITNSVKHAFIKKTSGNIDITIKSQNTNEFLFTYFDNGEWKEPKNKTPSFGIELIEILTSQLEGDYKRISNEEGTTYTFNVRNIDLKE